MITIEDLGTAASKTSGTLLDLDNVTLNPGDQIVAAYAYDTGQGAPDVTWGPRKLRNVGTPQAQDGAATKMVWLARIKNTHTRRLRATWAGAITAKAMFAVKLTGGLRIDVTTKNGQASTGSPDTGSISMTPAVGKTAIFTAATDDVVDILCEGRRCDPA